MSGGPSAKWGDTWPDNSVQIVDVEESGVSGILMGNYWVGVALGFMTLLGSLDLLFGRNDF